MSKKETSHSSGVKIIFESDNDEVIEEAPKQIKDRINKKKYLYKGEIREWKNKRWYCIHGRDRVSECNICKLIPRKLDNKNRKEVAMKEFYEIIEQKFKGDVYGIYKNARTKVICICSNGHRCNVRPGNIQNGQKMCKICSGFNNDDSNKRKEVAMKEFYEIIEQKFKGDVYGIYKNARTKVICICSNGHRCNVIPSDIQQGRGMCWTCSKQKKISNGEQFIMDCLKHLNIEFEREVMIDRYFFDLSFHFEDVNYFLEFDGAQHFEYISHFHKGKKSIFYKRIKYDIYKNNIAINIGYKMIRIAYSQIRKQTIEDFSDYLIKLIRTNKQKNLIQDSPLYEELAKTLLDINDVESEDINSDDED